MTTAPSHGPGGLLDREYVLGRSEQLATDQLNYLSTLLDRQSTRTLEATGVSPGWRCLDIGAGAGTITDWLAERATPDGSVLAVDTDIRRLAERPGLRVRQHDINDGVPDGPYDLIHARLLLMHLARREQILQALVDALAPGGWLVIGEYVGPQTTVLSAPNTQDVDVFHRVQHVLHDVLGRGAGISYVWAREVDGAMSRAGLEAVHTVEYTHTSAGGSPGCLLSLNYVHQMQDALLACGVTAADLQRYESLMRDRRFRAWFYPFLCTRGRRPDTEL